MSASKSACGYSRGEWSPKPHYRAECLTCGWSSHANNAQGNAARHARKYKHGVRVEVEVVRIYNHEP